MTALATGQIPDRATSTERALREAELITQEAELIDQASPSDPAPRTLPTVQLDPPKAQGTDQQSATSSKEQPKRQFTTEELEAERKRFEDEALRAEAVEDAAEEATILLQQQAIAADNFSEETVPGWVKKAEARRG